MAVSVIGGAAGAQVTLTTVSTGFNGIIGIDHHPFSNQVIVSSNYNTGGVPANFELIDAAGVHTSFSSVSGLTDEIKIATAKTTLGGFAIGDTFSGNGVDGEILKLSPDGSVVTNPWASLGAGTGLMRGSLHVDSTGVWGGDLLVVTTNGFVYRVNSAGTATLVTAAYFGVHLEGVVSLPNNVALYGPLAGKMLVGAEVPGWTIAIAPDGTSTVYSFGVFPEDFDVIPANENFFGVAFQNNAIMGAGPAQFAGMTGDVLVTQEFPGQLYRLHWDSGTATFQTTPLLATPLLQWEHVTFSKAGILEIPPTVDCLSQGFWKNHLEDWPVTNLTLGSQNYNQAELLALLQSSTTRDASLILARQLIAAKLNLANGCTHPAPTQAIADADALLSLYTGKLPYGVRPNSPAGQQMVALAAILEAFNLGL